MQPNYPATPGQVAPGRDQTGPKKGSEQGAKPEHGIEPHKQNERNCKTA